MKVACGKKGIEQMNKIKYSLIHRIYDDISLTSDELNMIIYLAKNADDFGEVQGIYYKTAAKELSVCHSQFYNVINSLQEKGYIVKSKEFTSDINIIMPENAYIEPDDAGNPVPAYANYLNLNMEIFEDKRFYELKVYAKKLLLALLVKAVNDKAGRKKRGIQATYTKIFHVSARKYKVYADKLHVSLRMIKQYFKDISEWISCYNDSVYTNAEIITVKAEAVKKPTIYVTENGKVTARRKHDGFDSDRTYVQMLCRRRNTDDDYEERELSDAAMLLQQYRKKAEGIGQNIRSIVERALSSIGNVLNAAALNRYISNYIANSPRMKDRLLPECE